MLVGITGGIGSGKSALARMLTARGARSVDADRVSREVVESPELVAQLCAAFGADLIGAEGHLDRRELGRRALATEEASRRLEEIIRPPLAAAIWRHLDRAREEVGQGVVIFDAPLIYEWGSEGRFDRMVVVDAAEDLRIQRVGERSGLSEGEIRERMNLQMDPDEKRARADYVIDNNGDMTALERQADNLWTVLIAEAGKGGGDG